MTILSKIRDEAEMFMYVVLLALFLVISHFDANNAANQLKKEINAISAASCPTNIGIINKYNDFVQAAVDVRAKSALLAAAEGNQKQAKVDSDAAHRYQNDLIDMKSLKLACSKPAIP